ncbi:type II secretion system protein GspK [Luteibacter aegosomatis]|uniref:general secretion pathway protein GspK n=1 Tax=Luteibacter aegosomatis TaxID=2911537 RepID=UPI001FFAD08F|nr:type II secretion system protein GspK [Luteibacter aegosomatis]UPG87516.1 type II secretion system protein GspK [Luteibacter aegosomatis]
MALLVVLWGCTLAAITLGALSTSAHIEGMQALGQYKRTKAFYAAQSGMERAVYRLRATQPAQRWAVDGRTYRFREDAVDVVVSVTDEDGKIDLNRASPERMAALLKAAGVAQGDVMRFRDAIVGWGKRGKAFSDSLLAEGGFTSLEELRRVPGLPADVVDRLDPALTLWSSSEPNLAHAPPVVVAAVTGAGMEASTAYVDDVRDMRPGSDVLPPTPGNEGSYSASASSSSGTVTIVSTATVQDDLAVSIQATVMLKGDPGDPRAYRVVRWRESGSSRRSDSPADASIGH